MEFVWKLHHFENLCTSILYLNWNSKCIFILFQCSVILFYAFIMYLQFIPYYVPPICSPIIRLNLCGPILLINLEPICMMTTYPHYAHPLYTQLCILTMYPNYVSIVPPRDVRALSFLPSSASFVSQLCTELWFTSIYPNIYPHFAPYCSYPLWIYHYLSYFVL